MCVHRKLVCLRSFNFLLMESCVEIVLLYGFLSDHILVIIEGNFGLCSVDNV